MKFSREFFIGFQLGYISALPYTICAFGVISHVFLIIAFIKDPLKLFRNSGTYLVANLALSDFLTCSIVPFSCCIPKDVHWAEPLMLVCMFSTVGISIFTVASISIDRFLVVAYPIQHRIYIKGKTIVLWLACVWLIGFAYPIKVTIFTADDFLDSFVMNVIGGSLILFTSVLYGITYDKLKKQSKSLSLENVSNRQKQARLIKEKRFLRTIILITCIVLACVLPTVIFFHYIQSKNLHFSDHLIVRILIGMFSGLYYANYAVNPLVYVFRLPNYRKTFCLLYCCKRMQH